MFSTQRNLLCQWLQHKLPLAHPYVRDIEPLMLELFVTVKENVEVNVARPLIDDLVTPHLILYGLKLIQ